MFGSVKETIEKVVTNFKCPMTSYFIGHFSVDGIVMRTDNLSGKLHICLDNGATQLLHMLKMMWMVT